MGSQYSAAQDDEQYYPEKSRRRRTKTRKKSRMNPIEKVQTNLLNVDITIFLVVTILVIIGVIMVFSASYQMAANSTKFNTDSLHFLKRNGFFAVVGFGAMLFFSTIHYSYYRKLTLPIYLGAIGLLIAVIIGGELVGGARRWLELPIIGRFQPSEVAKAAIIFTIADLAARFPHALKSWFGTFFFSGAVGIVVLLVYIPGGMSSSLIIAMVGLGLIFTASPYFWRFIVMGIAGVGAVVGGLMLAARFGTSFRGERFLAWQDPWADPLGYGFQVIQSLYAVATGGWFGLGISKSRQASFIPEPQNDMIFAIIVEELGLVGAGMILLLFGIFIWRGIVIAIKAQDTFSSLVAIGIVFVVAFQTIINIGVVTNSIPNTGVTLPFISYGGTSLVINMALAGVLLNVSRYPRVT